MYPNRCSGSAFEAPEDSPPSAAWLFTQSILGTSVHDSQAVGERLCTDRELLEFLVDISDRHCNYKNHAQDGKKQAHRERELLEWLAEFSEKNRYKMRALDREDAQRHESGQRGGQSFDAFGVQEAQWDPSKHPRVGGPPNAGWFATTTGGGGSDASTDSVSNSPSSPPDGESTDSVSRRSPDGSASRNNHALPPTGERVDNQPRKSVSTATPAIHSTSKGVPVHLAAAQQPRGHHWVSRAASKGFENQMDEDAIKVFKLGTRSPEKYNHAFDTWSGVTHDEYIKAMREILGDWIRTRGGKLDGKDAAKFLSWVARGKCDDTEFAAKHKDLFAKVFKWRKGFLQSIVVAHAAAEINPKLTATELKAIGQQVVNGESTQPLSKSAAKAAQRVVSGGKPLLKAAAKKILPGLVFFSAAAAARRGWAGQGHTGDGAWGAFNEVTRDLVIADVVEPIAFPAVLKTVDGLTDLLAPGLNAPGRDRYIRRGGRLIDLETGRIVD